MTSLMRGGKRAAAVLAALALLSAGAGIAQASDEGMPPPLRQAAIPAVRPTAAVLVAVARAGARLVAAGEQGILLLSDDEGRSWRQARAVPVSVTLTSLSFADASEGWATGHMGVILHSTDGGESWDRKLDGIGVAAAVLAAAEARPDAPAALAAARLLVKDGPDKPFLRLLLDPPGGALAVGAYGLAFATADSGRHWRPVGARFDNPGELHLYALVARVGATYAAGEQGLFLRAAGAGAPFERRATPYRGTLFGLVAPADGSLLAYGLRGTILRTEDEGDHWTSVPSGVSASLTCDVTRADGTILLGSMSGQFVASRDGGRSFAPYGAPVAQPIAGCIAAADDAVVVVGPRGVARLSLAPPAAGRGS